MLPSVLGSSCDLEKLDICGLPAEGTASVLGMAYLSSLLFGKELAV